MRFSLFGTKEKEEEPKKIYPGLDKDETEELQELIEFVKEQYVNHPLKGEEQLTRAYYKAWVDGFHYMRRDFQANKLVKETADSSRDRPQKHRSKLNYVRRNRNIAVSKVLKDTPVPVVLPASGEVKDIKAARIARAVLDNAFAQNEINLTNKLQDVEDHAYDYGTGWWKISWNPLLLNGKGNYQVTVHDDFEIYPDPSAKDWFTLDWVIHAYLQDIKKLESLHPKLKGRIKEWGRNEDSETRELYGVDHYSNNPKTYQRKAFVLEFVARNCAMWPKGKKLILINMEIPAKYGDNPFHKFGDFFSMNFIPFVWDPEPGKIHGRSGVADQIPPNKEIDKICSIIMENIKKTAAIKIGLPRGSAKSSELIGDRSHTFTFNPDQGGKPWAFEPAGMPSYVSNHLGFLAGAQQDQAGVHEVSHGQLPTGGSQMSGSALKLLQDSELVQHTPAMRRMKSSLTIACQLILKIAQEYYTEPRLLSIAGRNKRHEIIEFMGCDLDGAFDVKLEIGSAFNTSASAKIEGLLSLWKEGIIQEAEKGSKAARKVLAALEFGNVEEIYQLEGVQETRAVWVLDKIIEERKVPDIYDWENMDIYINVWKEFMLSGDCAERDDDLKRLLNDQLTWFIQKQTSQKSQQQPPPTQPNSGEGMVMQNQQDMMNQMLATGPGVQAPPATMPEEGAI